MTIRIRILLLTVVTLLIALFITTSAAVLAIRKQSRADIARYHAAEVTKAKQKLRDLVDVAYATIESSHKSAQDLDFVQRFHGDRLKDIIDVAGSIIKEQMAQAKAGKLTEAEARQHASAAIRRFRYDDGLGYVWINDTGTPHPKMIMHPLSPELEGKVLNDPKYDCAMGKRKNLFQAAVEVCESDGEGFVDYVWPKPKPDGTGLTPNVPKLSYVRGVEAWGWILGTGVYIDEVVIDAAERSKAEIKEMHYDEGAGYFLIVDNSAPYPRMVAHPIMTELEGQVMDDPSYNCAEGTGRNIFQVAGELCASDGAGFVEYRWPKPTEMGLGEPVRKVSYVRLFEPLGWMVSSGVFLDDIDAAISEQEDAMTAHVNSLIRRIVLIAVVMCLLAVAVAAVAARAVSNPLRTLNSEVLKIAGGNLKARVEGVTSRDEIGGLARSFNSMADNLSALVGQVQQSSIQLHSTVTELTATSREQEATAASFGASANQIAASVSEISATGGELVQTMSQVNEVATETSDLAIAGRDSLQGMASTMHSLDAATESIAGKLAMINEKAMNITGVMSTIAKVADQTNLLSVNAAIEAEKAGEYGVGFLVVAREIRRLADQTAAATLDIEQMVQESQSAVSAGVMEMDRFKDHVRRSVQDVSAIGEQTGQIIEQVNRSTASFERINEGMQNQSQGADQIKDAMGQLTADAAQTSEATREYVKVASELRNAVNALRSSIAAFECT